MHALQDKPRHIWVTATLLAGLVVALGGLMVAFAVTLSLADRQYRLEMLSERQAMAVGLFAELARAQVKRQSLDKALASYRTLIQNETALLPKQPKLLENQSREFDQVDRLDKLSHTAADARALRALSAQIARQEANEVAASQRELERLRTRTFALAIALTAMAFLCALSAAWLLALRNRSLQAMVQARTSQLEEVDRSRRLFFAKASHELRTPVTAMRGEAEVALLTLHASAQDLRQSLSHVLASATFLGHRIDELLGLASADDGKLQLERKSLDLGQIVGEAVAEAEAFARSVEVVIARSGLDEGVRLRADARWLRQALLTIIDNGLKFSPMNGKLAIELAIKGKEAVITVADDGPGVMPDDLPRIFDAYYQSEPGRQRGGNGLGLALARWVIEQHGGMISAANRREGGCCITIALPRGESV